MRPTALALNILGSKLHLGQVHPRLAFSLATIWPFLLGAVPFAFVGGASQLSGAYYRPLVGAFLLASAARLLPPHELASNAEPKPPPVLADVVCGAAIGLLSGLTGTGGRIFLSPLLLFLGWSETRTASGVAAVFILCNSVAGLSAMSPW